MRHHKQMWAGLGSAVGAAEGGTQNTSLRNSNRTHSCTKANCLEDLDPISFVQSGFGQEFVPRAHQRLGVLYDFLPGNQEPKDRIRQGLTNRIPLRIIHSLFIYRCIHQ